MKFISISFSTISGDLQRKISIPNVVFKSLKYNSTFQRLRYISLMSSAGYLTRSNQGANQGARVLDTLNIIRASLVTIKRELQIPPPTLKA